MTRSSLTLRVAGDAALWHWHENASRA